MSDTTLPGTIVSSITIPVSGFNPGNTYSYCLYTESPELQPNEVTFEFYPNPSVDLVYCSPCSENAKWTIYNSVGEAVEKGMYHNANGIPVNHLQSGVYVISIESGNEIVNRKLIIE